MRRVGYVYDDVYLAHKTPEWHPERAERLSAINEHLRKQGIWDQLVHIPPRPATVDELSLVHDRRYVQDLANRSPGYVDAGDTYLSAGSYQAASVAAGGVLAALERVASGDVDAAFCAVRPPGHHAERSMALGFCLFNNVALGAQVARNSGYERVAIVDFDVHHGNGTQHIFEEDPSVFYVSTHQYPHYPGTGRADEEGRGAGRGFTLNFPLPAGTGHEELLALYRGPIAERLSSFKPDILFMSAGYDLRREDPLSHFGASADTIRSIVRAALDATRVPALCCLEGGYDLGAIAESVAVTIRELQAPFP